MLEPVVVIVPVYNAEQSLAQVVEGVRKHLPRAYVLGVNDGSTDGSGAILKSVSDETVDFPQNRGKGVALRAGFDAALKHPCQAILTIDSDGQHDPVFAPDLIKALDTYDIAIGTRDLTQQNVPPHRRVANMLSSAATRLVSGGAVRDSQSGYRAFRRAVIEVVKGVGDRYEFETDFIVRAAHAGFSITNVPISTIYGSPSYFREFHDAMLVIGVLWKHRSGMFRRPKRRRKAAGA